MVSIQIDDQTAEALQSAATAAGVSVSDFLKTLLPSAPIPTRPAWDELEREFIALSIEGNFPDTFSRGDIYTDHD